MRHFLLTTAVMLPALASTAAAGPPASDYICALDQLRRGDLEQANRGLRSILRSGSPSGPIHRAAARGDIAVIRELIAGGCPVDTATEHGLTPLHVACGYDRSQAVRYLIQVGACIEARDEAGHTPLHFAARAGSVNAVQDLMQAGGNPNVWDVIGNLRDGYTAVGETPLHVACRWGHFGVAGWLLEQGADPNARDGRQRTPLDHLKSSLAVPADYTDQDLRLATLPDLPAQVHRGQVDVHAVLVACCGLGDGKRVAWLVRQQADVNATDSRGRRPLLAACQAGHDEVTAFLVSNGANPNISDPAGETPLHYAARRGWFALAKLLLDHGADSGMANAAKESPADCLPAEVSRRDPRDFRAVIVGELESQIETILKKVSALWTRGLEFQREHQRKIRELREQKDLLALEMSMAGQIPRTEPDPQFWMWLGTGYDKMPITSLHQHPVRSGGPTSTTTWGRVDDGGFYQELAAFGMELRHIQDFRPVEFSLARETANMAIRLAILAYGQGDPRVERVRVQTTTLMPEPANRNLSALVDD